MINLSICFDGGLAFLIEEKPDEWMLVVDKPNDTRIADEIDSLDGYNVTQLYRKNDRRTMIAFDTCEAMKSPQVVEDISSIISAAFNSPIRIVNGLACPPQETCPPSPSPRL